MGLACRSEENADRFFIDVLGLTKSEPKTLPGQVSEGLFGLAADLLMVKFTGDGVRFEVFIDPTRQPSNDPIIHACLKVEDRAEFLARCKTHGVEVIRVPKGEVLLTFIRDYDGNLYEIQAG
jgi:catechol 2,3-dioxygenase-like lactoylglutathione lyase family enzyme